MSDRSRRRPRPAPLLTLLLATAAPAQQLVLAARTATAQAADGHPRCAALRAEAETLLRHDVIAGVATAADAVRLAAALGDDQQRALALALRARGLAKYAGRDATMAALSEAIEALPAGAPPAVAGWVELATALVFWTFDDMADCAQALRHATQLAGRSGDPRLQAACMRLRLAAIGFEADPLRDVDRIEELFRAAGSEADLFATRVLRVHARRATGAGEDTVPELHACMLRAAELGDRMSESYLAHVLALIALEDGAVARALVLAERAEQAATALRDREMLALARRALAECQAGAGEMTEARRSADLAIEAIDGMGMPAREHGVLESALRLAAAADDHPRVEALARRRAALADAADRRVTPADNERYLTEYARLRREAFDLRVDHERELAMLGARERQTWYAAVTAVGLLALCGGALLFRSRRRADRIHSDLQVQRAASTRLEADRQALESGVRQLERLDSLGLLAAGFAHDFRTLLTEITGNVELLLAETPPDTPARQRLAAIQLAGERAGVLCRDVLAYTDRDEQDAEVVDLTALAAALQPMLRAGTGPDLELRFRNHDAPLPVRIDRARVEQVFLNLALNARDALAGRGHLRVEVTRARLAARPGDGHWFGHAPTAPRDYAVTRFTDDGEGMSAETIGRMFDPFFSTRFPGRGLGLAAAFGIVRRHDGLFEVHSQPGQGTTFAVWLPIAETAVAATPNAPVTPRPMPPAGRVLMIDDEQPILDVGERMLRRLGWSVTTASSAATARDALRDGAVFDCILLDFSLPDADGQRLLQELATLAPDTPIVVCSGHDELAVRAQLPADCPFLAKPFTMASLRAVLERATPGRR